MSQLEESIIEAQREEIEEGEDLHRDLGSQLDRLGAMVASLLRTASTPLTIWHGPERLEGVSLARGG